MGDHATIPFTAKAREILTLVEGVLEGNILTDKEALVLALVLDRQDLLDGSTILEAVEQLGPEWIKGALSVQRSGIIPYLARRASIAMNDKANHA